MDYEIEANTMLVELDKGNILEVSDIRVYLYFSVRTQPVCFFSGLRSGKVGEQCESIAKFPKLFEKHPFPIIVNSSFLKLGDVFREG